MKNMAKEDSIPIYLAEGFSWEDSPEGVEFWNYMDKEMIDQAKKLQPSLFINLKEIFKKL